jgi:hypothetical protein
VINPPQHGDKEKKICTAASPQTCSNCKNKMAVSHEEMRLQVKRLKPHCAIILVVEERDSIALSEIQVNGGVLALLLL